MAATALETVATPQAARFIPFGEFLVERGAMSRQQLYKALVFQDRKPGVRLGEVAVCLGYMDFVHVQVLLAEYLSVDIVQVNEATERAGADAG
jgi:hypothetical protein